MIEVLKASAGAGKTHRLTGEYIELLFSKEHAFKNILAVTFTNKATDEMKQRILEELYVLSQPGVKSDYLSRLMSFTGKDEKQVREQAKEILVSILHDYTSFRVSTIDKFFQMVMRSFARELGKMATYNVELDQYSVLVRAVDRMFAQLDDPKNQKLLEWLIDYSLEAVDRGSSWNVKGEILNLGGQIFSEAFKLAKENCSRNFEEVTIDEVAMMKNALKGQVVEFENELAYVESDYDLSKPRRVSVITGMAAHEYIVKLSNALMAKSEGLEIMVYPIRNDFFGHNITVAGLLCGCDMKAQLAGKDLGERLVIPAVTLRAARDVFLDGMTPEELGMQLGVSVVASESTGAELISAILG